jgi:hypothetical protein
MRIAFQIGMGVGGGGAEGGGRCIDLKQGKKILGGFFIKKGRGSCSNGTFPYRLR